MAYEISARIMDVQDELKRVQTQLNHLPTPADVAKFEGGGPHVTWLFHRHLRLVVSTAASATEQMMEELAEMDSAVRAALEDLTAHDADVASSAEGFEFVLDYVGKTVNEESSSADDDPMPSSENPDGGTSDRHTLPPAGEARA